MPVLPSTAPIRNCLAAFRWSLTRRRRPDGANTHTPVRDALAAQMSLPKRHPQTGHCCQHPSGVCTGCKCRIHLYVVQRIAAGDAGKGHPLVQNGNRKRLQKRKKKFIISANALFVPGLTPREHAIDFISHIVRSIRQ